MSQLKTKFTGRLYIQGIIIAKYPNDKHLFKIEAGSLEISLPVHGMKGSIIGLINLHGKSAPVIALDKLLNLRSKGAEERLFIALRAREGPLCFSVDELPGFDEITEEEKKTLRR